MRPSASKTATLLGGIRPCRRLGTVLALAAGALLPLTVGNSRAALDPSWAAPGWVPAGDELVGAIGDAGSAARRTVRFDDGEEIEEYGRISPSGWRAEYLYLVADGADDLLPGTFDVPRAASLFRHNEGGVLDFGPLGRIDRPDGAVFFRPYTRSGESCFGFEADLSASWPDPSGRPAQLLTGYACRDGSHAPSMSEIRSLVSGFVPMRAVSPDHLVALPAVADAAAFALGRDQADSGLIDFPLSLAKHYVGSDAELL